MAKRHFPRQINMQSKSRYNFFKNQYNWKLLKLRKIVYLLRCFSLARKLLMRRFRGSLNYILNVVFKYMLQKNIQWQNSVKFWESRSGTKVALFIYNFTNFHRKNVFQIFSKFCWKSLKIEDISEKFIACSLS